jgi:hypothetical protein
MILSMKNILRRRRIWAKKEILDQEMEISRMAMKVDVKVQAVVVAVLMEVGEQTAITIMAMIKKPYFCFNFQ